MAARLHHLRQQEQEARARLQHQEREPQVPQRPHEVIRPPVIRLRVEDHQHDPNHEQGCVVRDGYSAKALDVVDGALGIVPCDGERSFAVCVRRDKTREEDEIVYGCVGP